MTDNVINTSIIKCSDALSRACSLFSGEQLSRAVRADLSDTVSASAIEASISYWVERGMLIASRRYDDLYLTDRTARFLDGFARATSDPTHTNARVSLADSRNPLVDRSNPLNQSQRYSILDVRKYGSIANAVEGFVDPIDLPSTYHIHGNKNDDIARFELYTPNLFGLSDFIREAKKIIASPSRRAVFGPDTVFVYCDTTMRSAYYAIQLAAIADRLRIGKVLIMADPERSTLIDRLPITHAIRAGAAAELDAHPRFRPTQRVEDLTAPLLFAGDRMVPVANDTVELAAARAQYNDEKRARKSTPPVHKARVIFSTDPVRLPNLNKAVQALRGPDPDNDTILNLKTLTPIRPSLYNTKTGAGLRQGDVLEVTAAPEGAAHSVGDRLTVSIVYPIDATIVVETNTGRMDSLPLEQLAESGMTFTAYTETHIMIGSGDLLTLQLDPDKRVIGRVGLVTKDSFAFSPLSGGRHELAVKDVADKLPQLAFATKDPQLSADQAVYVAAGIHDRDNLEQFSPGGAYIASRMAQEHAESEVFIFSDDPSRLTENARAVANDTAQLLQDQYASMTEHEAHPPNRRESKRKAELARGDRSR